MFMEEKGRPFGSEAPLKPRSPQNLTQWPASILCLGSRCVGQSRRRLCGQALPEAQKATVTANRFGWDAKPRQRRALFPTCRALTGDSRNATRRRGFSFYRAWPYAVAQAGGRFELPAVLEYRQRSGFGDDKLQFQFRFHRCDANFGTAPGDASGR